MIRPAREADFPTLRGLILDNGLGVDGLTYETFDPITLVYEREGTILGFIQGLPGRPYGIVTEVAIDRHYQHRGLALKLLDHLETVFRVMGVTAWVAFAGEKTESAAILERLGRCQGQGLAYVRSLQ